jgi:[acyl-carrier-protein] S-malonyltransferase
MTKIAFMFPCQGSMEPGKCRDIAESVPEAMAVYEEGSAACGLDLRKLSFEAPVEDLVATEVQQPVLVTACLAIEEAIRARGIHPDFVVGHSVGEFAALTAADTLSVRDAIALVRERGLAMAEAAREMPGAMAAILGLADEVVEQLCRTIQNVWPANYNCPGQLVISGSNDGIDEAVVEAQREGARRAIKLRVSGAFHSPLVARAAERLKPAIEKASFGESHSVFMSTVTAKIEDAQHYRELLLQQLTAPVRFTQAAGELVQQGVTTFVEVGPGNVLSGLLKRIDRGVKAFPVNNLKALNDLENALG